MLPANNRLKKQKELQGVLKRGRASFSKFITAKYLENTFNESRFGFIISLKISKKAVKRNRLKRQLREIIRLDLNKIKAGYDVVVITKPGILDLDYPALKREILEVFKKARLIK